MFTSIVRVEDNRVAKYLEFPTYEAASAHCEKYGGFVYEGHYMPILWVESETVTIKPLEQEDSA